MCDQVHFANHFILYNNKGSMSNQNENLATFQLATKKKTKEVCFQLEKKAMIS